jgi:hypothetical protein
MSAPVIGLLSLFFLINITRWAFAKQARGCRQRRILVGKDSPIRKNKENRFSFVPVEVLKISLLGEFKERHSDGYHDSRAHRDELPESPVVTKMVPCSPCMWG